MYGMAYQQAYMNSDLRSDNNKRETCLHQQRCISGYLICLYDLITDIPDIYAIYIYQQVIRILTKIPNDDLRPAVCINTTNCNWRSSRTTGTVLGF